MSGVGGQLRNGVTIAAGLVVVSGVAAAVFALATGGIRFFTPVFVVVSAVAVLLGLPVYLAARAARKDTALVAALMGFIIAAAIPAVLILAGPAADEASIGETATVVDGAYTAAGWLENLRLVGLFGLLGVGAGLLFWLIVRRRQPAEAAAASVASPLRSIVLSVAAVGVIAAAFIVPRATMDRTCHNTLRDGRDSIAPVASFDLQVGVDDWRNVEREMNEFGRVGHWSIRSDVRTDQGFPWLQISLCKEPGTQIFVQGLPDMNQVAFTVMQPQGGSSWRAAFRALHERISARWPTKVVSRDEQGGPIAALGSARR